MISLLMVPYCHYDKVIGKVHLVHLMNVEQHQMADHPHLTWTVYAAISTLTITIYYSIYHHYLA